jgi:crotonobetainyl-CoA:carnitine CoA-transferase CaiB-like acyl-CoA transferase
MLLYGPYIDFIASTMGAAAVLAALEKSRTSGEGSHLDVSQYECGLMFLAGPLLAYHDTGAVAQRAGNTDPDASPHGVWPCRGGSWVALSCWSAAEFGQLCRVIGRSDLARDPAMASTKGRRGAAQRISDAIGGWAAGLDAVSAADALQRGGVHAHAVSTVADLFTDPQLRSRGQWRRRPHAVFGEVACAFPAFDLSDTPGEITSAAPLLGEHNQKVFAELLAIDPQRLAALQAHGALD